MLSKYKQYKNNRTFIWFFLFSIAVFLTLNKNSKNESGIGDYQSAFWSDKGGYYIYLPWALNAGFDASQLPENIEKSCGDSFEIIGNKVQSKYMIGVALLQIPFYLAGHAHAMVLYESPTGFEKVYADWIGVGSAFYLILGIYFSFGLIRNLFGRSIGIISVIVILAGTNLWYYAIDETMMPHVFGFSLIAVLNWLIIGKNHGKENGIFLLVIIAMLFLLRPTSMVYVILLFSIYRNDLILPKLNRLNTIFFILSISLIFMQVIYWYFIFGTVTPSGYANEGFTNWLFPKIGLVLFSPNNGWFPYALAFGLLLLTSMFFLGKMLNRKIVTLTYLTLILMIYITASWWTYDFGCGMGARNLVDFSAVWMLFTGLLYQTIQRYKKLKYGLTILVSTLCLLNLNLTYSYDNCYFGEGNWDWNFYYEKLLP